MMISFLVFFFLIYGGAHIYAFTKIVTCFRLSMSTAVPLGFLFTFMVFAPLLIHYLEKFEYYLPARALSYIGYTWLGVMFLFVSSSFALDFYRGLIWLIGALTKANLSAIAVSLRASVQVPLIISAIIGIYGYFEARNIRLEKITVETLKLPANIERVRIAQISDVHLGLIIREERLRRILDKVKEANPDIFISTGDLVDGEINRLEGLAEMLAEVKAPLGKYAIRGNHEYFAGIGRADKFTERAGFRLLSGESVMAGPIEIAGLDDPAGRHYGIRMRPEGDLLRSLPNNRFKLFLKHRPELEESSFGLFDLQLSGHAHKGQIFPFSLVTRLYYPADGGRLDMPLGSVFYVSRGTGTWGPPIRFLAPPEVTLIELIRK
jgi:predicted MPP superfamily phosphohydrolase